MAEPSPWIKQSRDGWRNRGQARPDFALTPGPEQESVWDYPRPPALVPDQRLVTVSLHGVEAARTSRAYRVLETASPPTFYLPPDDVRKDLFQPCGGGSLCEWKGQATYWSVVVPGHPAAENAAWSYEQPFEEFAPIAGYVAFYPALLECRVDGVLVTPQPGRFYGGWVTPEIVGPFKGEPGTQGW